MDELLALDGLDDLCIAQVEVQVDIPMNGAEDLTNAVLLFIIQQPSYIVHDLLVYNCVEEQTNWFDGYVIVNTTSRKRTDFLESYSDEVTETVTLFMHNANRFRLLSISEEKVLVDRMTKGDEVARTALITSNLRLVVKIAHDFKGRGLSLDDLVAEGSVGLMKGVSKYQLNRGAKVSSYVAWWIKQAMHRAIANQSRLIRMPVQSAGKWYKIKRALDTLTDAGVTNPTNEEISVKSNLSERTVSNLRGRMATIVSLDDKPDNSTVPYSNMIADTAQQESAARNETTSMLYDAISQLSPREQFIVKSRFGIDDEEIPLPAISKAVGRTRERVRQIERAALEKLRAILGDQFYLNITHR